uniref:hypothetical protein n=1 Tax=Sodalis glossinidius TaxID=63612 RepID=UPI0015E86117
MFCSLISSVLCPCPTSCNPQHLLFTLWHHWDNIVLDDDWGASAFIDRSVGEVPITAAPFEQQIIVDAVVTRSSATLTPGCRDFSTIASLNSME